MDGPEIISLPGSGEGVGVGVGDEPGAGVGEGVGEAVGTGVGVGVGVTPWGLIVIDTVAVPDVATLSLTLHVNESVPLKPLVGVYVRDAPVPDSVPCSGD